VDLIQNNAFRIFGLPATAQDKEIIRRFDELITFQKIGLESAYDTDFLWMGEVDRSEESLNKTLRILQTPKEKIIHAIFWFWQLDDIDKLAFSSLSEGDLRQATEIWTKAFNQRRTDNISYLKNLATLKLAMFVEETRRSTISNISELKSCFDHWADLLPLPKFWQKANDLVGDVNLVSSDINTTKADILKKLYDSTYPILSLEVNVGLEVKKEYLKCFASSTFPDSVKEEIIADYLTPIRSKIDTATEKSNKDRSTLPKEALIAAQQLVESTKEPLIWLDSLLSENEILFSSLHDKVAEEIRFCCIDYVNVSNDRDSVKPFLLKAKEIASGILAKDNIEKDISIVNECIQAKKDRIVIDKIYDKFEAASKDLEDGMSPYEVGHDFAIGLKTDLEKVAQKFGYLSEEYKTTVKNAISFLRYCSIEAANKYKHYIRAEELIDIAINLILFKYTDGKTYAVDSELAKLLYIDKSTLKSNSTNNSTLGEIGRGVFRLYKRNKLCRCGSGKKFKDCCSV